MIRITAIYPNSPGSRFDAGYYRDRHEPLARGLLTPGGLTEIRSTIGVAGLDGAPPPFCAVSEMVFASRARFDAVMAEAGPAIFADIANYTDVAPMLQLSSLEGDEPDPTGA